MTSPPPTKRTKTDASAEPKVLSSKGEYDELIDKYDAFLFDCDGVIWHGDELIPGVKDVLEYLRKKQKKLIFVTNNATQSRASFKAKFDRLGLEAHIDEIFGSAYATVGYLKYALKFPEGKKVYVIGEKGIEDELDSEGIGHYGGTDPEDNQFIPLLDFSSIKLESDVGAVICGFDMHMNYKKFAKAFSYLHRDPSVLFLCTNTDSTFPAADGNVYPGSGAISAPLRSAIKREATVVGKPEKPMLEAIEKKHHLVKEKTIMIGDRLDTDILFGVNGGISTLLVLTGVQKKVDYESDDAPAKPEFVVESLGDLKASVA